MVVLLLVFGVGAVWAIYQARNQPAASNANTQAASVRQRYADLYELAWRSDQQQGTVLMTATLLSPTMITLLGQDTGRSDAEDALYRATSSLSDSQLALYLTIDSVGQPVEDVTIAQSLNLTAADGLQFSLAEWRPVFASHPAQSTEATVVPKAGVAIFTADRPVHWDQLKRLTLDSKNIAGIPDRAFVWNQLSVLQ